MENSKLYTALAKAQLEFEPVHFDSSNPHFRNRYASLAAIRKATQPALSKHGFSINQAFIEHPEGSIMVTTLAHESGDKIESKFLIKIGNDTMQQIGSKFSYIRRYSLCALLNVSGEEEDDGEEDRKEAEKPKYQKPKEEPKPVEPKMISMVQVGELEELVIDHPELRKEFLDFKQIKTFQEVPVHAYEAVKAHLNKRIHEKARNGD